MWATSLLTIMLLFPLLSAAPLDIAGGVEDDNDGLHSHAENVTRRGKYFVHNQFDFSVSVQGDAGSIGHEVKIDVHDHTHDHHHHEDDTVIECKEGLNVLFKSMDSNKNGLMDAKELLRVCHQNNFQITESSAVRMLTLPDKTVGFNLAKFCELLKDCPSTNSADLIYFLLELYDKVTCPHKDDLSDVLLENNWRTQNQIIALSEDDQRNTVIVEVEKMTGHTIEDLQGRANAGDLGSLTAIAKMAGLLIRDSIMSSSDVETMAYSDLRNTLIVEASQQFSIKVSILQSMTDRQLLKTFCTGCEVHVGKSTSNTISATVTEGCVCPTLLKGNWHGDGTYPDEFKVTQDGSSLQVQRTDSTIGWSMDLSFMCKPGKHWCKGRNYPGGRECCEPEDPHGSKCTEGQGDCDSDAGCAGDLVCGRNNCRQYHSGASLKDDCCIKPVTCSGPATLLSTSPRNDMVLCKDEKELTCEKDFESLCPTGWNLCTPGQFNNRNDDWNYNWADANAGYPLGAIYCYGSDGYASHYGLWSNVLNIDEPLNCDAAGSTRPGCEHFAGQDCDEKGRSALCCAPTSTCGDGVVQEEEDCDELTDYCLNTCTWKKPGNHGQSGCS